MMIAYLILLLAVVAWKGYYAWQRAANTYRADREQHDSLREYLLGNGATQWQAMRPYYRHALQRAVIPLKSQWRLAVVLLILGMIVALFS